jgi:hypothetical protein
MLTLAVKSQWVRYKLDETIEKPHSDHTPKEVYIWHNGDFVVADG